MTTVIGCARQKSPNVSLDSDEAASRVALVGVDCCCMNFMEVVVQSVCVLLVCVRVLQHGDLVPLG